MTQKILTAKEISELYAESSDVLNGELFEIEGILEGSEFDKLRDFNLAVVEVFPLKDSYLYQIGPAEPKPKKGVLLLTEIAKYFPKLITCPMAFDGKTSDVTNFILHRAGFGGCYSEIENITVIYKKP